MAFAMGISVEEFKHLTPYKLECCLKGHKIKREKRDEEMWLWFGSYGLSAVSVAVEHCLAGKKAKSKFIDKPVLSKIEKKAEENRPLTEEEKKKQTEALFMKLRIMGSNFNLNHGKDGTVS